MIPMILVPRLETVASIAVAVKVTEIVVVVARVDEEMQQMP
jgi:hypothetical protein